MDSKNDLVYAGLMIAGIIIFCCSLSSMSTFSFSNIENNIDLEDLANAESTETAVAK